MEKRVAVCLSGQLRNLDKAYQNFIKPNLYENNIDCEFFTFAHVWFSQQDIGQVYNLSGGRGSACKELPQDVVSKLYENYNPQKTLIEKQIDFRALYKDMSGPWNPENRLSKMYSIKQSCKLKNDFEKENGFIFDAVVLLRYDLDIRPIKISDYDVSFYNTTTHAAHAVDVTHAITSSENFDKFSLLYDEAKSTVKNTNFLAPDEEIARAMLDRLKVPIKTHKILSGYSFVRA